VDSIIIITTTGTFLVIFRNVESSFDVTDTSITHVAYGMGIGMGNKAGIAARVVLNDGDITLCFVGAHFDAGRGKIEKRNDNFAKLSGSLKFDDSSSDAGDSENNLTQAYRRAAQGDLGSTRHFRAASTECGVDDHDIVFWFGDLNYRISKALNDEQVRDMILYNRLAELAKYDQLVIERLAGNVFQGFEESVLKFKPTYRFYLGTVKYDVERVPAWCDRVLWKIQDKTRFSLKVREYDLVRFPLSDHMPVCHFTSVIFFFLLNFISNVSSNTLHLIVGTSTICNPDERL
jgi:inositol polyphosphate 5-phosphatase INPP5B/F